MRVCRKYGALSLLWIALGLFGCREETSGPPLVAQPKTEAPPEPPKEKPPYFVGAWQGTSELTGVDPQHSDLRFGKTQVAPPTADDLALRFELSITISKRGVVEGDVKMGTETGVVSGLFADDSARLRMVSPAHRGVLVLHHDKGVLRGTVRLSAVREKVGRAQHSASVGPLVLEKHK